jgi:hypothetical protein
LGKFPSLVRFLKSPNYPGATISPAVNVAIKHNGTVSILVGVAYYFNTCCIPNRNWGQSGKLWRVTCCIFAILFPGFFFQYCWHRCKPIDMPIDLKNKQRIEIKFGGMFFHLTLENIS